MRCGILIIGSLLWDDGKTGERAAWRAARLDVGARTPVRVPVHYGRESGSRGNTYTMAFRPGESSAQAVLVPCAAKSETAEMLVAEANALWQAEDANAKPGALHKPWGCVGALFKQETASVSLAVEWTAHFRKVNAQCVSLINADSLLDINWPATLDGQPADFDVILGTATRPETEPATAPAIADAWADQHGGHENYFFNNVKHGIRTPDDLDIWRRIEERSPPWLNSAAYEEAIDILRAEAKAL